MMTYTITRAVYSIHYTTSTERGTMRFAGPDLETVLAHFAAHYAPKGFTVDTVERFHLSA